MKDPLKPRDKITQHMTRDGLVRENQTTGEVQRVSGRDAEQNLSPAAQEDLPVSAGGTAEKALNRAVSEYDAHAARKRIRKANSKIREGEAVRQCPGSRLQFSDEERGDPALQKYIRKSETRADKLDTAREAIPKKRVLHKERVFDEATGTAHTKLRFDKVDKTAPKIKPNPAGRPVREAAMLVHGKIHEVENENVGVESGHKGEELAERGAGSAYRYAKRRHISCIQPVTGDKPVDLQRNAQYQQEAATPDTLMTGERITTPRGSFHVTGMTREQMEAAGYGYHHSSEDGKYLIMGNGTQAYGIAAEQRVPENYMRTAELTTEQNYNMIDGRINNTPSVDELEEKAKRGEVISLSALAAAVKTEDGRTPQRSADGKKPSIRAQLKADREQAAAKPKQKEKGQEARRSVRQALEME